MVPKTVLGYADRTSAAPGETIRFMVSSTAQSDYRADLVRIICGDDRPAAPGMIEEEVPASFEGVYRAREQAVHSGSYVRCPGVPELASFHLQAFVWATRPHRGAQAILARGRRREGPGMALFVDDDATVAVSLRGEDGREALLSSGVLLRERHWTFVAASYDAGTGELVLVQRPLPRSPGADVAVKGARVRCDVGPGIACGVAGDLWMAAWPGDPSEGHYDGRIDSPRLASRPLTDAEADELAGLEVPAELSREVLGCWDFSREIGSDQIVDRSPHGLHGTAFQLPTRAVKGHRWNGEQCWRVAPEQYGAIHFHEDDLYDADWEHDFDFTIPEGLPSGVYAARLRQPTEHGESDDYLPFFVRPPSGCSTADTLYLASTATYMAYANQRLFLAMGELAEIRNANDALLATTRAFGLSQYEYHSDGSGVHFSSLRRPVLNFKPKGAPWSFTADTLITHWLEHAGNGFDVQTDEDLHREGVELLARYRVVVTGAHPEYWSTDMRDAMQEYLRDGGRLIYMGANGFYWRVAFDSDHPGAIEVRRAEDGTRAWIADPGEYYHAWGGGEYGGLWRRLGRPPNELVGVGFAAQGFGPGGHYRMSAACSDPRVAFALAGTQLSEGEILGAFGCVTGGAAGEEIDRCDLTLGSPPHALVLASSEGHGPEMLRVKEEFHMTAPYHVDPQVRADLCFFECPRGGAVFSTGAISWSGSLAHDDFENDVARVTTNVLLRFLDPEPFELPG